MKLQHVSPKRSDLKGDSLPFECSLFFSKALQPKGLCLRVKCAPCLERVVVNHQTSSLAPTDEAPKKWVLKKHLSWYSGWQNLSKLRFQKKTKKNRCSKSCSPVELNNQLWYPLIVFFFAVRKWLHLLYQLPPHPNDSGSPSPTFAWWCVRQTKKPGQRRWYKPCDGQRSVDGETVELMTSMLVFEKGFFCYDMRICAATTTTTTTTSKLFHPALKGGSWGPFQMISRKGRKCNAQAVLSMMSWKSCETSGKIETHGIHPQESRWPCKNGGFKFQLKFMGYLFDL